MTLESGLNIVGKDTRQVSHTHNTISQTHNKITTKRVFPTFPKSRKLQTPLNRSMSSAKNTFLFFRPFGWFNYESFSLNRQILLCFLQSTPPERNTIIIYYYITIRSIDAKKCRLKWLGEPYLFALTHFKSLTPSGRTRQISEMIDAAL